MTRLLPVAAGLAVAMSACSPSASSVLSATITSPSPTSAFTDADEIRFTASFTPARGEPGVAALRWTSSLFGELHATQAPESDGESSFARRLSAGDHQIGFFVTFADGRTASDQIALSISASGRAPAVEILSPLPADTIQVGQPVDLEGLVASTDFPAEQLSATWLIGDPDGAELALPRPTIDPDGVVTGTWTPAQRGPHTLVLRVSDPDDLTGSASVQLDALDLSDIDNDEDGYTADVDCDDDDPEINPGARDEPDMDFVDRNCDGIDGDIARSVFVDASTGSPDNDGLTPETPVSTLTGALAIARATGRPWVLLPSRGDASYTIPVIQNGISIAGGYQDNFARRSESAPTTLRGEHPARGLLVWRVTNPVTFQNVRIESVPPTPSVATSSVALHIFESSDVLIEGSTVRASAAIDAPRPAVPDPAASGDPGENGKSDARACIFSGDASSPWGGAGGDDVRAGGKGGEPGTSVTEDRWGKVGENGEGGAMGGNGANAISFCVSASAGRDGANGSTGATGAAGEVLGFFPESPRFPDDVVFTPHRGTDGRMGTNGGGGGGGGGGSFGTITCSGTSNPRRGGGGGGGGGGGAGGEGGPGAEAGGSSIALVITASTVRLEGSTAVASEGGFGAHGAAGGSGGTGGEAGLGGTSTGSSMCGGSDLTTGARGGAGGRGGSGGSGGGGAGGSSIAVWCLGSPSVSGLSSTELVVASAGAEGGRAGGTGALAPAGLAQHTLGCP